jgi:type III secretion protein J
MARWRIMIVVMVGLLAGACQTELYRGLTQRDANEMTSILLRNGIDVKRESIDATTYKLMVPDDQFARAVDILKRTGYPRESFQSLGDVFKGDGLIVSPYEQRIRMMHAQNQELARTISSIDGVVNTRVHVVVPELDLRGAPQTKPTASVVVHHRAGVDTGELSTKIRLLVANSLQGLNYRDVSIAFFVASDGILRGGTGETFSAGFSNPDVGMVPSGTGLRGSISNNSGSSLNLETPEPMKKDNSIMGMIRTIIALILWGLAVIMALAGVVFLILNAIGGSKKKKPGKTAEGDAAKPATKPA